MLNNKQTNKPKLRFKEFKISWSKHHLEDLYEFKKSFSFSRDQLSETEGIISNIHYGDIHTKYNSFLNVSRISFPKIKEIKISISDDDYCKNGDLIIADASEDYKDIGKGVELYNVDKKVIAGLHTFLARPINFIAPGFSFLLIKSPNLRKEIMKIATGASVLGISKSNLSKISLFLPNIDEQKKIADFFTSVDNYIQNLKSQKEELEKYKKGIMQKIFSQQIRFKDENGKDFPDWENVTLEKLLDFEQPTKYIVKDTDYSDYYKTPVLTAGKSFILGYTSEQSGIFSKEKLPVLIFDDFTTSFKFVNFPFKVKSSALKILLNKDRNSYDIRFIYNRMLNIKFNLGDEHKRYWISEYSKSIIEVPTFEEQKKIADFLASVDKLIENKGKEIENAELWKKGLIQQMFI